MPCASHHSLKAALMNSGPLSQRSLTGRPHCSISCASKRTARTTGSKKSASVLWTCRLKPLMTWRVRKYRPSARASLVKSSGQHTLGWAAPRGLLQALGQATFLPALAQLQAQGLVEAPRALVVDQRPVLAQTVVVLPEAPARMPRYQRLQGRAGRK